MAESRPFPMSVWAFPVPAPGLHFGTENGGFGAGVGEVSGPTLGGSNRHLRLVSK